MCTFLFHTKAFLPIWAIYIGLLSHAICREVARVGPPEAPEIRAIQSAGQVQQHGAYSDSVDHIVRPPSSLYLRIIIIISLVRKLLSHSIYPQLHIHYFLYVLSNGFLCIFFVSRCFYHGRTMRHFRGILSMSKAINIPTYMTDKSPNTRKPTYSQFMSSCS